MGMAREYNRVPTTIVRRKRQVNALTRFAMPLQAAWRQSSSARFGASQRAASASGTPFREA